MSTSELEERIKKLEAFTIKDPDFTAQLNELKQGAAVVASEISNLATKLEAIQEKINSISNQLSELGG